MLRLSGSLTLPTLSARSRKVVTVVLAFVAFVAVALRSIFALVGFPGDAGDFDIFGPAGARLLMGQWEGIFANPVIQAGVLELGFWGIAKLLGVGSPVMWVVFYTVSATLLLLVLVLLIERPLRAVVGNASVLLATAVAALAALTGGIVDSLVIGHPAQVAIPLLWLAAGLAARDARPFTAAALLGLSTGWEVWGILGVPVLLLAPRIDARTLWRSAVGLAAVIAVLFLPFILLGPFRMLEFSWLVTERSFTSLLLPGATTFPWPLRLAQGLLAVAAGAAVALSLRRSLDALWLTPLTVCAVRLLFDPVLAGYYTVAPALLVLVGLVFTIAQRWAIGALACLLVLNVLRDIQPLSAPVVAVAVLLVAVTVVMATRRPAAPTPVEA